MIGVDQFEMKIAQTLREFEGFIVYSDVYIICIVRVGNFACYFYWKTSWNPRPPFYVQIRYIITIFCYPPPHDLIPERSKMKFLTSFHQFSLIYGTNSSFMRSVALFRFFFRFLPAIHQRIILSWRHFSLRALGKFIPSRPKQSCFFSFFACYSLENC
jgi:hypothetical protein